MALLNVIASLQALVLGCLVVGGDRGPVGRVAGVACDATLAALIVGPRREALVGRLIEHARARVSLLRCSVGAENKAALELYRRTGFVKHGIEPRSLRYEGRGYDEELLVISFD